MCRFSKTSRRTWVFRISSVHPADGGFSLIEVLVAMAILATGILGVLSAFSLAGRTGDRAFRLEQAALLAERELELAMHQPSDQQPLTGSEPPYTWRLEYMPRPHELTAVRIEVAWLGRGQAQTFELERVFVPRSQE